MAKETPLQETSPHSSVLQALILFATIMSGVVAAIAIVGGATSFYNQYFGWREVEQSKIESIAPMQPKQYFDDKLGVPTQAEDLPIGYRVYTYSRRGWWATAYVNKDSIVDHLVITACGVEGFHPTIRQTVIDRSFVLGKDKLSPAISSTGHSDATYDYFSRGASAPTYFYDIYPAYGFRNMQGTVVGFDEICGQIKFPAGIMGKLLSSKVDGETDFSDSQLKSFRSGVVVTTYGISSPNPKIPIEDLPRPMGVTYRSTGAIQGRIKIDKREDQTKEINTLEDYTYILNKNLH